MSTAVNAALGKKLAYKANRTDVAERFVDPEVRKSIETNLTPAMGPSPTVMPRRLLRPRHVGLERPGVRCVDWTPCPLDTILMSNSASAPGLREACVRRIGEGPSEVHRMVIARSLFR